MGFLNFVRKALDSAARAVWSYSDVIVVRPDHHPFPGTREYFARMAIKSIPDPVTPVFGAVLYSDSGCGYEERSGIYVGSGEKCIARLANEEGKCIIKLVSPDEFISGGISLCIYVSSHRGQAAGRNSAGERALSMAGRNLGDCNIAVNNCHMFTNYCLLDKDDDNAGCDLKEILAMDTTLSSVKKRAKKVLNADEWRQWRYKS